MRVLFIYIFVFISTLASAQSGYWPRPILPATSGGTTLDALARYRFETDATDEEGDYDGSEQNGIGYNGTYYAEGSYSIIQNGADKHILVPSMDVGNNFSILFRLRAGSGVTAGVIGQSASSNGFNILVDIDGQDFSVFTENSSSTQSNALNVSAIQADTWVSYAAVFDRTGGTVALYVNGADETDDASTRTDYNTSATIRIGVWKNGSWNTFGYIDDVQIYDWELTSSEVSTWHSNPGQEITRLSADAPIQSNDLLLIPSEVWGDKWNANTRP